MNHSKRGVRHERPECPPLLAELALKLCSPARYRDQQVGDLREAFAVRQAQKGRTEARRWYRRQVLKSLVPNLLLAVRSWRPPSKEGSRKMNPIGPPLWQDLSYGIRSFARRRLFYSVVLLTYALGIGATTVVFSVVDGILLRPLPYPNSDRLVSVYQTNPGWMESENPGRRNYWDRIRLSYPVYTDWLEAGTPFEALGIYTGANYIVTGGDRPERVSGIRATAGVFEALGVPAMLGRVFIPADDEFGAPGSILLSHGLWQRRFGSDSTVVGQTMVLDDIPYRIVGVMPRGFAFPEDSEVWTTLTDSYRRRPRFAQFAAAVATLPPGVHLTRAQQEMERVVDRLNETYADPAAPEQSYGVQLIPLKTDIAGNTRPAILLILGAVGLVLIIACCNNVTLLLLQASERRREMAVRSALGAGRRRLLRQMLTEALVLSAAGGSLGWLLAALSIGPFIAILPAETPRLAEIGLDHRILAFGAGLSVLTGLMVGLLPALAGMRTPLTAVLGDSSPRALGGRRRAHIQKTLVVFEVAVTFVLLVGAGLLTKSFLRLTSVDLGFGAEDLVTMRLDLRRWPGYPSEDQVNAAYRTIQERLESLPGVVGVAAAGTGPFFGSWATTALVESRDGRLQTEVGINEVTPSYFEVMGIPLLAGRFFSPEDQTRDPPVAIVSEQMARTYWPHEAAVGRRMRLDGVSDAVPWYTVVGVVGDVRRRLEAEPFPTAYRPVDYEERILLLKTTVPPTSIMAAARGVVASVDPNLPVLELNTLEQRISNSAALPRVRFVLMCSLAGIAGALALIGIFGVLANAVAQRTDELGIRRALGAETREVVSGVLRQGLLLTGLGVAVGLVVSLVAVRTLRGFLFQVDPLDPGTLLSVALFLAAATLAACYFPARRAAIVDPVEALRRQ